MVAQATIVITDCRKKTTVMYETIKVQKKHLGCIKALTEKRKHHIIWLDKWGNIIVHGFNYYKL